MRYILMLFLLHMTICANSQQSIIRGQVSVINSLYENMVREYVANAQVEEDFERAQPTTTDAAGYFHLNLVGIKEKESISYSVKKQGFEVVNTHALYAVAGQTDLVKVYMAPPQKINEYRRQYYKIGKTNAEKTLEEKLKNLKTERQALLVNKKSNEKRINDLETQLGILEAQRSKIDEDARELARRYATINLDDASPLYQEAFSWFQQGDLVTALSILQKSDLAGQIENILAERTNISAAQLDLLLRDSVQKRRTEDVLSALSFKADLHKSRFEWDSTTICFELMLKLDSLNYYNLFNFAHFLARQNQHHYAIVLYKKAKTQAKTDFQLSAVYNNLGNLYSIIQNRPLAEFAYGEALSIQLQLGWRNSNKFQPDILASTYGFIATLFKSRGVDEEYVHVKLERAKSPKDFLLYFDDLKQRYSNPIFYSQRLPESQGGAYERALQIQRELIEKDTNAFLPDLASTLNNYGNYLSEIQNSQEAEKCYKEALNIRRQLANTNPDAFLPDLANTLNSLGVFYSDSENIVEAERYYDEALSIRRQLSDVNPNAFLLDLTSTLNNIGNFYSSNQNKSKAEKHYYEALYIRRQLANQNPDAFLPYVANTLNNIAGYHSINQNYLEAEKYYNESLSIRRKLASKNPSAYLATVAQTLFNLGLHFRKSSKYSQALDCFEECLTIHQNELLHGQMQLYDKWVEIWAELYQLKDTLIQLKEYRLGCRAQISIASTFDSLVNNSFAIIEYGNLSWWALFAHDFPLAERAALRCLELDPEHISVQANIGHAHLLQGNLKKAKEAYLLLKGKKNGSKNYKTLIEEDFQALEAENITHPHMAEIRKWLREEW